MKNLMSTRHISLLFAVATTGLLVPSAYASRTELDSRGLPQYLAVDVSNLTMLPASAMEMSQRAQIDVSTGETNNSDSAFGMVGTDRRFAYSVSESMHNLLLAVRSGWGLVLGYRNDSEESNSALNSGPLLSEGEKTSDRKVRLGLGWKTRNTSGRLFEVGLRAERSRYHRRSVQETEARSLQADFETTTYGVDMIVRTLTAETGLLAAVRVGFANPHMELESTHSLADNKFNDFRIDTDFAYRYDMNGIDDLVVGFSGGYRRTENSAQVYSGLPTENSTESAGTSGNLFVSMERNLSRNLSLRTGVGARVRHLRSESSSSRGEQTDTSRDSSSWTFEDPTVNLGLGWAHDSFTIDAHLKTDIELDEPLFRWATTFAFD